MSGKPLYLYQAMSTAHPLNTREAAGGQIWLWENFDSTQGLVHNGFKYRGAKDYNLIPDFIRSIKTLPTFMRKLKQWVTPNIPVG
jgi:hypothetical protein